jgi:predicted MPP superfamily phosphohydrolase
MNEILFEPYARPSRGRRLKKLIWKTAGSLALGGLYPGKIHDNWLRVERHDMPLRNLGKGFVGAKIAHISDLHSSPLVLDRYLRQCVETINRMEVDFVAITGDFITGARYYARHVAAVLKDLSPRVATIACLGNHDYGIFHPAGRGNRRGLADYISEQLWRADVFLMLNETRVFRRNGACLQFVGLEDYWSGRYDPVLAFDSAKRHLPTVALVHNPDAAGDLAACGADWVLSGHTHGTAPKSSLYNLVMPHHRKFYAGKYPLGSDRHLYVTRGIAYGRRKNINSRPEITVFTLKSC